MNQMAIVNLLLGIVLLLLGRRLFWLFRIWFASRSLRVVQNCGRIPIPKDHLLLCQS